MDPDDADVLNKNFNKGRTTSIHIAVLNKSISFFSGTRVGSSCDFYSHFMYCIDG